jgi:hypothetical protein
LRGRDLSAKENLLWEKLAGDVGGLQGGFGCRRRGGLEGALHREKRDKDGQGQELCRRHFDFLLKRMDRRRLSADIVMGAVNSWGKIVVRCWRGVKEYKFVEAPS